MYYPEYGEPSDPSNRYISNQAGYVSIQSQQMHHYGQGAYPGGQQAGADKKDAAGKYLNKFSQWMPDLKLKKISKRYRSHSLPAVADSDDDSMMQQHQQQSRGKAAPGFQQAKQQYGKPPKDYNSKSSMFTSPIKSGRSFLQRKSLSLSTPLSRDDNNSSKKKKRSIASTMSNIMQKAKVYRRHSFSHSTLTNEQPMAGESSRQIQPGSKFMITKPQNQSYSQSDPESVYSDFFSDNEDRSASDFAEKDLSNVVDLFATMDQSAAHQQRSNSKDKDADQGI